MSELRHSAVICASARSELRSFAPSELTAREPNGGLLVLPDTTTLSHRSLIIAFASRHRLPAVYPFRYFADSGFGAGAAPGKPRIGKLYFNAEWLSMPDIIDILAPYMRPGDASTISAWATACAAIGYDFDSGGMRKIQVYVRPDVSSGGSSPLSARGQLCAVAWPAIEALGRQRRH